MADSGRFRQNYSMFFFHYFIKVSELEYDFPVINMSLIMDFVQENKISMSTVEDRIHRIANILLLNASFIDNPGLLNGKTGIAIFF